MVPVVNKPVMEYSLELLKRHDITEAVVTLQFLPQLVKNYFGEGSDIGLGLTYVIEEKPLGTAGSVKNAETTLSETFVVLSGDALTDIDLGKAVEFHRKKKALATIVLKRVENPLEFGVVITDKDGRIERFLEKPTWAQVFSDTINTGIYILEPEILEYIPADASFDFSHDLFPLLLRAGQPLYGCILEGYWCDIGSVEQYVMAHQDMLSGKARFPLPGIKMEPDLWIGEGASIHPSATLSGPVVIGQHALIGPGVRIDEFSVIGNNVVVRDNGHVHRSILWENSYIGSNATVHGAVIGRNTDVKGGARIEQGVVVGDESVIGENAIINHDVKIYPFKRVDDQATINTSIIWESRGMRNLFGKQGVSGLINIDITAEFATRLAMAFGTHLKKGSSVVSSRDANRASRLIKRSIIAGLLSTGVSCQDLRVAPPPVNRFNVAASTANGGIHVSVSPFDPQSVEISFYDENGLDISEGVQRSVERCYFREDFRRAFYNEIGELAFPPRAAEFYLGGLLGMVDEEAIRNRRFKLVVDYGFGTGSLILPQVMGRLNADVIAMNASTREDKTTLSTEELELALEQLSRTVRLFHADIGALIGGNCERVLLVDDRGRKLDMNDALHLMVSLVAGSLFKKGKIAVPLTVSSRVDEICARHHRRVVRTKVSPRALMEAAQKKGVAFAGAQGGRYIFPRFMPAHDAVAALVMMMECLAKSSRSMSDVVAELPEVHLADGTCYCPWDQKGLVMRKLIEGAKGKQVQLEDGIKMFNGNRWVLILPDPEEPVVRVCAEAESDEMAEAEVETYIEFVRGITAT